MCTHDEWYIIIKAMNVQHLVVATNFIDEFT
jgi:hypothetical protein